jgi:SAM-dependent methyltransferase
LVQVIDLKAYWQDRAKIYGKRAVYNLGHGESELEDVTSRQHHAIFPLLESMPLPPDPEILDFGCGPGRFSLDIATATGGRVVGVDFTPELLDLAPRSDRVSYQVWDATFSESNPGRFDLIWVCLVLGGIPDPQIGEAISALKRMMKPGSWIVLAENTTRKPNSPAWSFRAVRWYEEAFSDLALKAKTSYNDLGEKITVFIGGGPA